MLGRTLADRGGVVIDPRTYLLRAWRYALAGSAAALAVLHRAALIERHQAARDEGPSEFRELFRDLGRQSVAVGWPTSQQLVSRSHQVGST